MEWNGMEKNGKEPKKSKASPEQQLYAKYCRETQQTGGKTHSLFAIREMLTDHKFEDLDKAIENYVVKMPEDLQYRIRPRNFFTGRIEEFLPDSGITKRKTTPFV